MAAAKTPKFTLRFDRPQTHDLLRLVAERCGVSMNSLAEDLLARELGAMGLLIEQDLYGTLDLLQRYRGEDVAAGLDAFARAEVTEPDPLRARMVDRVQTADALGVAAAFS
jgi:hypothetical protein